MRILVIEPWSPAADHLIQELNAGTGANIDHANTVDDGLQVIEQKHGAIDIMLYAADSVTTDVLGFPERVRAMASEGFFRCPQFILLATNPLPLPCAARCIDRQIIYLLREYPKQIVETVRALLWKIRASKPGPTIRVEFYAGHYRFYISGSTSAEELTLSKQIAKLLLLLLRGTYTVDALAEELGIQPNSVKKYVMALRFQITKALQPLNLIETNGDLVWMRRGPGGTLCGLRANPLW